MTATDADRVSLRYEAEGLAVDLPPLLVAAERVAATVLQGVHGRRRVGQGETFWQYRRYGPGDSAAQIDWRQSARSRHVYVRETEWEAAQTVWLWADTSRSMHYRSNGDVPHKVDRARLLLLALAVMLARGGERFTFLGSGVPAATGRAALYRLTDLVLGGEAPNGLPPIENLPRHGQVVLIGDFLDTVPAVRNAISALAAQGMQGQIVHLLDPAEEDLPFEGRVRFQGVESDMDTLISRVDAIRSNYMSRIKGQQAAVREISRDVGWKVIGHRTDQTPESCLLALFLALASMQGR